MLRFIIPAYNEEQNIESLINKTAEYARSRNYKFEIVVVNDGSTDKTLEILKRLQNKEPIVILNQIVNKGVGEAFKRGFYHVAEASSEDDIIVTKEADNTSDLSILDNMIKKISDGNDLVLASCYMPGGEVTNTSAYRRILSSGANLLLKLSTPLKNVHTFSSFYRAYRASLIKKASAVYNDKLIEEKGFSCMVELLIKLSRLGIKITEVPMTLKGNMRKDKSKMKVLNTISGYLKLIANNFFNNRYEVMMVREDKTHAYFNKEYADFDASYKEGRGIKDIIRSLTYSVNKKAISGRLGALLNLVGDDIKGVKILEVGCGPGIYSIKLAQKGAIVTGIDYSRGMIDAATNNAEKAGVSAEFILADFMKFETKSKFDYVFATGVIEYIKNAEHVDFINKMKTLSDHYVLISFPKKYILHAFVRNIWLRVFKGIKISFFTGKNINRLAGLCGLKETGRVDSGILWVVKFKKIP